ncbi:hypothetical protein PI93_009990 [Pandoraea fibrosis]|uniref:Preprotein translocase subunit SecD n=1 Tax=Pandoraea fibrosis TaxID=1891094 RepID=A0ABX6HPU8_9BURK|nr:hypothetical protein [Pandoraea fibrosis]QHE93511.1 hypothetical protein PJ20_018005 [Pandoraea fibrosis]QHF12927.1 hypothetical protein PI93_009990 [Pandoraea fibrosis]
MEMLTRTEGTAVTNAANPKTVRQPCADKCALRRRGVCLEVRPGARPCPLPKTHWHARLALSAALAFASLPAFAQSTSPGATPPAASAHAPIHRPGTPHPAPPSPASTATDTVERPALPRLVAIATPENDDDIPRFALFAARDIEQLGLQFPAQKGDTPTDTEVVITMSLRDGATTRMRDFSRQHMNEPMTLIVDGVEMLTATIRSELGGKFQLQMPKEKARLLFQRVLAKAGPAT